MAQVPILMDTFVRLTKAPGVSLARIRGCVSGVSSEFVLACDMRFASRENTKLGHPELGVGLHLKFPDESRRRCRNGQRPTAKRHR
jgi:enoyl-CoA hydratase/carnithine racemase